MEAKKKRMQELVELLNRARRAYEQEDTEIMSNYEYDTSGEGAYSKSGPHGADFRDWHGADCSRRDGSGK